VGNTKFPTSFVTGQENSDLLRQVTS